MNDWDGNFEIYYTQGRVLGPPAAPSNLQVNALRRQGTIGLRWWDNSGNEDGFELERSLDGIANWTLVASLSPNSTSFTDAGLNPGTATW